MKSDQLAIFGGVPVAKSKFVRPFPFGEEEKRAVLQVLKSGAISKAGKGVHVKTFKKAFAAYHQCQFAVATSSGTAALHTAVRSLGIGPQIHWPYPCNRWRDPYQNVELTRVRLVFRFSIPL